MIRRMQAMVLSVAPAVLFLASASAGELVPIGSLPKLAADWERIVDDQPVTVKSTLPFRWIVFRHARTGDLLSIATHPDLGGKRELEYLSSTALEIFPNGRPVWTKSAGTTTNHVVKMEVVDAGRTRAPLEGQRILQYCFISENPESDNRMAQGRAWVGPKCVVFVQHTSTRPITDCLVERMITSIARDQTSVLDPAADQ